MNALTYLVLCTFQCVATVLMALALTGCGQECQHLDPGIGMGMVKEGRVYRYVPMPYEQAIASRAEMAASDQQALDALGITIEQAVIDGQIWANRHQAYLRLLSNYEQFKKGEEISYPYWRCSPLL